VLRRIKTYLDEVCDLEDPRQRGKGLAADRSGYWRYRVGDWRIIAEIRDDTLTIVAIGLGHRSDIYRNQKPPRTLAIGCEVSMSCCGDEWDTGRLREGADS
jgi:mRNA interferase RelE/StbE